MFPMMLMYGYELMTPFQMVDMAEVSTEAPTEESTESVLEAVQEISTISDHICDKAVDIIKLAQE